MQKFSSFGQKKKNRPKFDIEWLCSKTFNYIFSDARVQKVGTGFVVINLDYVTKKYQTYHEKYMAQ